METNEQRARLPEAQAFAQMLEALSAAPTVISMLQEQSHQLAALREEIRRISEAPQEPRGWLDAKAAATYLGLSATTFDKYRYHSSVKVKGYKVGGKTLYKRADLDSFVKLFELNSAMSPDDP